MRLGVWAEVGRGRGEETGRERRGLGLEEGRGAEVREVGPRGLGGAAGGTRSVGLLGRVAGRHA